MARKKAGTYGVLELAKEVIEKNNKALSASEIWEKATDEQKKRVRMQTEKPEQNIYSAIYNDIKNHDKSEFVGVGRNPIKWQLKTQNLEDFCEDDGETEEDFDSENSSESDNTSPFKERDLHKLLVSYVGSDSYFSSCYCKTIYHERSDRKKKGLNRWVHPDIVGVSYPFGKMGSYEKRTLEFMSKLEHTECRLYSFEMKIQIKASDLRNWFFEAVSNSSWAHEGYLVALDYEPGIEDEMKMLNESFGIGFIQLSAEDYKKSSRLLPAKRKEQLDWNMINRLLRENPDFREFVNTIEWDMASSTVRNTSDFDEQFKSNDEFLAYIREKRIGQ